MKEEENFRARPARHLDYVDGCRGLAVLVVLIFHATVWSRVPGFVNLQAVFAIIGRGGVDLFLVLSGFCLTWPLVSNSQIVEPLHIKAFAWRRFIRIVPPYYFALFCAIGASIAIYCWGGKTWWQQPFQDIFPLQFNEFSSNLLAHFTLFHGFTSYCHSIDGAFWSLSLEWQFYFLFPILVFIARKRSCMSAFLFALTVSIAFRLAVKILNPALMWVPLYNEISPARWGEFGAGMFVAQWVARGRHESITAGIADVLAGLAVGAVLILSLYKTVFLSPILCGLAAAVLLAATAHPGSFTGMLARLPSLTFLGNISYSLYLLHGSLFMLLSIPLSRTNASPLTRLATYVLLGMPLAVSLAYWSFHLIEKPCMKKRLKRDAASLDTIITDPSATV